MESFLGYPDYPKIYSICIVTYTGYLRMLWTHKYSICQYSEIMQIWFHCSELHQCHKSWVSRSLKKQLWHAFIFRLILQGDRIMLSVLWSLNLRIV